MITRARTSPSIPAIALTLFAAQACTGGFTAAVGDAGGSLDGTTQPETSAGNEAGPDALAQEGGQADALAESGSGDAPHESEGPEAAVDAPADAPNDGAGDATPEAGPWTPTSLGSALVLWLEGDEGTTTAPCGANTCVSAWADQSGTSPPNSAGVGSGGTMPLFTPGAFSGHSAITFDGDTTGTASLAIGDAPSLEFTGGYTLVAVAFPATSASPHIGALYGKTDSASPFRGPALWVNYANTGIASTSQQAATQIDALQWAASSETNLDGKLAAFSAVYDGSGHLDIRVNDDPPTTTVVSPSGPLTAIGRVAYVGGAANSGQVLAGSIAEVIVVSKPLSATDWSSTYLYLKSKYAALP